MSTQTNPLQSQPTPPPQPSMWQRIGQAIGKYAVPITDRLAAAAGNYAPLEYEHQQQEFGLRSQMAQQQMENEGLRSQLLRKDVENYQTPEQKNAMALNTFKQQHELERELAPPQDIVAPMPSGGMGHYQRQFNSQTQGYDVTPTMVNQPAQNPQLSALTTSGVGAPPSPPGVKQVAPPGIPGIGGQEVPPIPQTVNERHQLPAMMKPQGGGMVVPDPNSQTGYSRELYDSFGNVINRIPNALPPYAQQGVETSTTTSQEGPTGVTQVNRTSTTRNPVGGGASSSLNPANPVAPLSPSPRSSLNPSAPPKPTAIKLSGGDVTKLRDQNVTLGATNSIINRIRANESLFASMIDAGKIQLVADPASHDLTVAILSRDLTPQEQKLAGDWQSLAEHINILRQPLGGTGFRGEEAWGALQAQRGRLTQAPGVIDQTLNNTQQIIGGLRNSNKKALGPLDIADQNPSPYLGETKQFPNGRTGTWDGHGWAAQ